MSEEASLSEFFDAMPRVTILAAPNTRSGVNRKTGESFRVREQAALLRYRQFGQEVSIPFELRLEDDQPEFRVRDYMFAGKAFDKGQYGRLEMNRFRLDLVPVPEPIQRLIEQDRERRAKAA